MEKMEVFSTDLEEPKSESKPSSKTPKRIIILLICIIIILISLIIILIIKNNKDDDDDKEKKKEKKEEEEGPKQYTLEETIDFVRKAFLGEIYYNLTYADGTVENTFKLNGKNYREEIGEVNGNKDYESNSLNQYDLYMPYSALKTKKTKGILLFVHGGAWIQGVKEEMSYLSQIYFEHEYIIANLDYTLLSEDLKDGSIYRIIDDISACIANIKYRLKNQGFNESELEVAIGGGSAGGHLSLLYGYLVKEPPLPIKFIIDTIGPVNLETDDFYKIEKDEDTLPDIEPETVNKAIKENTYKHANLTDDYIVRLLNLFIGNKYTKEELKGMLKNNTIDKSNEKYIELFNKAKYGFPINWMEGKDIPILALYGGKDEMIGFIHFARLRETALKYNNTLQLVYSRYGGHGLSEFEHEEGIIAAKDFHFYMLKFCDDYFTKY